MSNKIPLCDTRGHAFADEGYDADDRRCMHCDQLWSTLRADAQALADVRTLDAAATETNFWRTRPAGYGLAFNCARMVWSSGAWLSAEVFDAETPDAARAKAAAWVREQAKGALRATQAEHDAMLVQSYGPPVPAPREGLK
jgi:hypothetical protein